MRTVSMVYVTLAAGTIPQNWGYVIVAVWVVIKRFMLKLKVVFLLHITSVTIMS